MFCRSTTNLHNKYDTSAIYYTFDTYVPNETSMYNSGYWKTAGDGSAWNSSTLQAFAPVLQGNRVHRPQGENAFNNNTALSNLLPYDMSVSCWVRNTDGYYVNDNFFSFFNNGDGSNRYFIAGLTSTTNLRIKYKDGTTAQTYNFTVTSIYGDNNWHNFTFTLSSTTISLYQDGAYVGNTSYTPLSTSYPFNTVWGSYDYLLPGGPGKAAKLVFDAFRVYTKVITADHISHIWDRKA